MGRLGKDAKDLIFGNDGSDKEPDDFKTELQRAIDKGIISKSDGTLLITSRMNADKLADLITKSQEKGVAIVKGGKTFDNAEEEKEYKKKKEEEKRRKERENEVARKQIEAINKKKENAVSNSNISQKSSHEIERNDEKQ